MNVAATRVAAAAAVSVIVMAIDTARRRTLRPGWPLTATLGVAVLGVLTLVTRLPYFFVGVINWDESTFILMGHAFADGYLPYTKLWDNKPPLLFALFGLLARLPGDPVFIARAFGALCVLVSAVLVARIARTIQDRLAAEFAAVLYVFGMAVSGAGQATVSEVVSTVPLLAAVWLMADVSRRRTAAIYAGVGALVAAATLIRLNLGIVALAFGLWIIVAERRAGARQLSIALCAYGGAGLVVLAACALPYVVNGELGLFWYSVFRAPFRYATTQGGLVANLVQHARNAFELRLTDAGRFAFGWVGWVAALAGLAVVAAQWRGQSAERRTALVVVTIAGFATGLSVVLSGAAFVHYLLAVVPFVAIFAGAAYAALARVARPAVVAILGVAAAFAAYQILPEYLTVGRRLVDGEPLMHGEAYQIADYLRPRCTQACNVYMTVDHVAYVLLGLYPPRKLAHPSNVARRSLLDPQIGTESTPELELGAILASKPDYIVKLAQVPYLDPEQQALLDATLASNYKLATVVGDRLIYSVNKL